MRRSRRYSAAGAYKNATTSMSSWKVCLHCSPRCSLSFSSFAILFFSVLAALGFASWQRALIARAGQSTTLEHGVDEHGDTLRIVTQDLRGTSQLELPLSGGDVSANDGDGGARVCRSATIERGAKPSVVVTERFPHEREPYSICRRTLQADGRMCIDVTKRTGKSGSSCFPLAPLRLLSPAY